MKRRYAKTFNAILAATALSLTGGVAQAELITNGDFASNAASIVNFPGYAYNVGNLNPYADGWNPDDGSGDVFGYQGINGVDTDPSVGTPFGPVALDIYTTDAVDTGEDVSNYAFLQSNTGPGNTFIAYMLQNVTFQPDTTYTLSFVAAARSSFDNGGYDSGSNTLVVLYSDDAGATETTLESYVQENGDISDLYFTQYAINFTTDADADAGYLKFLNPNADEALDHTVVFSNVSIVEAVAGIEGDLNGDGFVGLDDLDIILSAWNQNVPPADSAADPSGDGFVGLDDLDVVLNNWNAGTPPAASTVPEPAGILLLGMGGLTLIRRR